MSTMLELMHTLRAAEADPVLRRLYELAAADIIVSILPVVPAEGIEDGGQLWDPAFNDMTAEEREAFIADAAIGMAPALMRAAICWNLLEAPTVSEWLARRRANAR